MEEIIPNLAGVHQSVAVRIEGFHEDAAFGKPEAVTLLNEPSFGLEEIPGKVCRDTFHLLRHVSWLIRTLVVLLRDEDGIAAQTVCVLCMFAPIVGVDICFDLSPRFRTIFGETEHVMGETSGVFAAFFAEETEDLLGMVRMELEAGPLPSVVDEEYRFSAIVSVPRCSCDAEEDYGVQVSFVLNQTDDLRDEPSNIT